MTGVRTCFVPAIAALGLVGCTGIPLDRLQPTSTNQAATCPAIQNVVDIAAGVLNPAAPGGAPVASAFTFVLPSGASLGVQPPPGGGAPVVQKIATFDDFVAASKARLANLPPDIRNHDVTDAIFRVMVKTSAQAQLNRARLASAPGAAPISGLDQQQAAVTSFSVPDKLTPSQLKDFADKFASLELQPGIIAPGAPGASPSAFATYFTAYYEGNFVDRFGQSVSKPNISLTIPDAEIGSALTVLVEYVVDLLDPTPVLGDKDLDASTHQPLSGTTFYPGGKNTKEPTALSAQLANYKNIGSNKCGVTTSNAVVLEDIANAAGDRAAAISGLVSQSWGGISFGLGVLGKFSIGDNQTLGTIVKTAATRLGERVSYAASYWALDSVGAPSPAPGAAAPSPQDYLQFP